MLRLVKLFHGNFPLQIHVWGGLGSQLHAVFLSHRIRNDFPTRRVSLIFHSSGVTRRPPEVLEMLGDLHHIVIDDYAPTGNLFTLKRKFLKEFKQRILSKSHLIESCNDEGEYKKLRWWTLQTRGHYSNLNLSPDFSRLILSRMRELGNFPISVTNGVSRSGSIHVRLGDLLEIQEKNPTNFYDIIQIVKTNCETLEKIGLYIYSDSPNKAKELLKEFDFAVPAVEILQNSARDALVAMVDSAFFIGTGSKLSLWVTILRFHTKVSSPTFLPSYLKPILECLIPELNKWSAIIFYDSIDF